MLEVRFLAGEGESMCVENCKKQNKQTETPCAKKSARGECSFQAFSPSVQGV